MNVLEVVCAWCVVYGQMLRNEVVMAGLAMRSANRMCGGETAQPKRGWGESQCGQALTALTWLARVAPAWDGNEKKAGEGKERPLPE